MATVLAEAPADAIPTRDELVARARALQPDFMARAVQAERDRHVPRENVEAFTAAGLVRTLIPRKFGGYELGFEAALDVGIELGRSTCGSSAWCLSYLADHAYLLALFPEQAQRELWSENLDVGIATSFAPTGKVEIVEGGYRLSGKWAWASGIGHSDWIIIGGMVFPEGGDPDLLLFLVPKSDITVHDDWFNVGLRASGSATTELDGIFVPPHRTCSMAALREGQSPGAAIHANRDYHLPLIAISSYALLGPAIGLARGAYENWRDWTRTRVGRYTQSQLAHQNTVQIRLAETAAKIDAAELLVRRAVSVATETTPVTLDRRVLNRRDFAFAVRMLVEAVDGLMQISGASGLFDTNPIQRVWRDVRAISCHVMMNFDAAGENFGRLEFGVGINERDPFF
jgi:3-hydroxy-9,10-secoandrosta-1,3,5(10)-triene-9,17-dione monooxygenase